ncbi:DUF356 domain-containing protein [Methanobacterium sp. SMA-27]|jgi:uncharacterized protein|uniref:DUF356 domain-containing protein n=1 Tax=Methanobacterium sp. SMA-27 TaxID=1495336 RepID=UPI00064EF903|nr:DUF356 domain-containing protein [Methanobacterium sp. SMA-27]
MALILIRAEDQGKLLNTIADIERHAGLKVAGKPRILNPKTADEIAGKILKQELRSKSDIAVLVRVEDDTTKSIVHIRKIHPPAHVIVISEEYGEFKDLEQLFNGLTYLKGYYSHKNKGN